jgi:CBS domain-containing protein
MNLSTSFDQGVAPRERVIIIRRGAIELLDGDQILDGLGEGDLFGHPSMLTGLPTEFAARAAGTRSTTLVELDRVGFG